jgi:hypothetical protein
VRIQNSGRPSDSRAQVAIWGLPPSLMLQLNTLGQVYNFVGSNTITIQAGDAESGMTTVFSGTIAFSFGDYSGAPDVPFRMDCVAGLGPAVQNAKPLSFCGAVPASQIMSSLASALGCGFENSLGANDPVLRNQYLPGSLISQVDACRRAARIGAEFVVPVGSQQQTLAVFDPKIGRTTPNAPLISASTGMVGYPTYVPGGIHVKTVFNPQIPFAGQVQVQSAVQPNGVGTWVVAQLDHALDSLLPHGEWSSDLHCYTLENQRNLVQAPP